MRFKKNRYLLLLLSAITFVLTSSILYAAETEDVVEQRQSIREERREELKRPERAQDIIEMLKERALLRVKEKRRQRLLKTRLSASVIYGFEGNVTQASDTKGDHYQEEDFSMYWQPTFNKYLGLDTGYWLVNQSYFEQTDSSSLDHAFNFTVKLTPFENGKLKFSLGGEFEQLWYPLSKESSYTSPKHFLKFTHYIGKKWNYGGGYEYSEKAYDAKMARNQEKAASTDIVREDTRHTVDFFVTRYLGKWTLQVKGKAYVNFSNDHYQDYYDFESWRPSLSIARSFLEDDKLYVSFSPSYERKNYHERKAVDNTRYDDVYTYKTSIYYTLKKPWSLNFSNTYKKQDTNLDTSRYKNITNTIGLTADF